MIALLEAKILNVLIMQLLEQRAFNNVIKALENRSACLMSNHGQVAFGKNLAKLLNLHKR